MASKMAIVALVHCSPTCSGIPAHSDNTVQMLAGFQQTQKCLFPNVRWEGHFYRYLRIRHKNSSLAERSCTSHILTYNADFLKFLRLEFTVS